MGLEIGLQGDASAGLVLLAGATSVWSGAMSSSILARADSHTGPRRALWTLAGAAVAANGLWANYYLSALALNADRSLVIGAADTVIAALCVHLACAFAFLIIMYRRNRAATLAGAAVLGANVLLMHYVGLRSVHLDPGRLFDLAAAGPGAALLAAIFVASVLAFRPDLPPLRRFAGVAAAGGLVTALNLLILAQSPPAASPLAADLSSASLQSVVFVVTCLLLAGIAAACATDKMLADRDRQVRALDEAVARLRDSERAAKAADAAKSEFVADISHEIRTPLTAILGMLDLLDAQSLTLDQRRQIVIAKTAAEGLLTLANDLVDLAKLDAGKLEPSIGSCDLAGLAQSVVDLMRPSLLARPVALRLIIADGFPAALATDAARVRQILLNLVGNAIKFTERGTITVALDARAAGGGAQDVTIVVEDTGAGMSSDVLAQLFRRFSQTDVATPARFGGAGLGLAISAKLATTLGGALTASSVLGAGSRFVFRFYADTAPATVPAIIAAPGDLGSVLEVLIVDDQEANRYLAERLLARAGIIADTVSSAEAALERLRARRFDAILLDLQMPGIDGVGAARQIRALAGSAAATPMIAYTAAVSAADRQRCSDAGIAFFVEKPVKPAALYAALGAAVGATIPLPPTADCAQSATPGMQALFLEEGPFRAIAALIGAAETQTCLRAAMIDIDRLLAAARAALTVGDVAEAKAAAHAVKSLAADWGAARLRDAAARLERGPGDRTAADAALDDMVRSWSGARALLVARSTDNAAPQTAA